MMFSAKQNRSQNKTLVCCKLRCSCSSLGGPDQGVSRRLVCCARPMRLEMRTPKEAGTYNMDECLSRIDRRCEGFIACF